MNTTRLREYDAMRGFSMLLVVYWHSMLASGCGSCISNQLFLIFRMPLFFFISGFFAYHAFEKWDTTLCRRIFSQKIKAQIICPIVFYALLYFTKNEDPLGWINRGFQGYWFTIALFQMFVIYSVFGVLSYHAGNNKPLWGMVVLVILSIFIHQIVESDHSRIEKILSLNRVCQYFKWYFFGIIARCKINLFEKMISTGWVKGLSIVGLVAGMCIIFSVDLNAVNMPIKILIYTTSFFGLLMIISLFHSARDYFNSDNRIAKFLCFTGRRTLDIYMIHYFFLPRWDAVGEWLLPNNMFFYQLVVGFGMAIIVTAISLLVSNCLRSSDVLAEWLFGVRPSIAKRS